MGIEKEIIVIQNRERGRKAGREREREREKERDGDKESRVEKGEIRKRLTGTYIHRKYRI